MFTILKGGVAPKIKTEFSSSADLCSRGDITIGAGETKIIPLGVKIDLEQIKNICFEEYKEFMKIQDPKNGFTTIQFQEAYTKFLASHFFELKLRSSLAIKAGLIIANGVGEIDIDYPDEIGLIVHNPITTKFMIEATVIQKDFIKDPLNFALQKRLLEIAEDGAVKIKTGERVAQIKLMPHKNYLMPDEYRSTAKRVGGFGSTGSEG